MLFTQKPKHIYCIGHFVKKVALSGSRKPAAKIIFHYGHQIYCYYYYYFFRQGHPIVSSSLIRCVTQIDKLLSACSCPYFCAFTVTENNFSIAPVVFQLHKDLQSLMRPLMDDFYFHLLCLGHAKPMLLWQLCVFHLAFIYVNM